MPKTKTIRKWIEMSQGFIHNSPPKQRDWDATLFANNVELRENSKGEQYLIRSVYCEFIEAETKQDMEDKIGAFMLREDVRILAKGIEANDFDRLPRKSKNPSQDEIDGISDIYDCAEQPAGPDEYELS